MVFVFVTFPTKPETNPLQPAGFRIRPPSKTPDHAVDFSTRHSHLVKMKYRVVIEPDEDGVFVAECPALRGCISQGKTRAEALVNIKDAMTGYLSSLKKHGEPVPPPISEEIVEIPA